ncbi:phage integrase SAM-like domain-containing protein [Patescibacteria group bacterium]|nr:phage integrase SAM-like domain-containing protein [Patescibacteria group bacterium]MCL5091556.1 phage integrase SAM-like domain-containing protein [Patescibacteria group bacterium]
MDNRYNLDNFEAGFRQYLIAENRSRASIKNYLSDYRHFAGWMINELRITDYGLRVEKITSDLVKLYKAYLSDNLVPNKTVNRRLSALRKFCSFCIDQGWMKENPAKQVTNIGAAGPIGSINILAEYRQHLTQQKIDQSDITSYLSDAEEFYQYVKTIV